MARDYAKSRSKKKSSSSSGGRRTSRLSSGMLWLFIGIMMGLLIPSFGYIKQHVISLVEGKKPKSSKEALLRDPIPQKVKPTQQNEIEELEQPTVPNNKETPSKKINAEKPAEDNVDFDFYTILPDSEATKPPATKTLEKNLENAEQKLLAPTGTTSEQKPDQTAPAKPKKVQEEEVLLPTPQFKTSATPETVSARQPKPIAKPEPKSAPTPKPLVPAAKSASGYILQLGSFKTFEEAEQLKAQLSFSGLQAKIKQTTINGITRQRVWIGIYSSLEAAEKAQKQLAASNLKSALAQVK